MKNIRTNVILPEELLLEIDRIAGMRRRSTFLADAAREKLTRMHFERAASMAFGSWKDEDHPDLVTDRDMRRLLSGGRQAVNRRTKRTLKRG